MLDRHSTLRIDISHEAAEDREPRVCLEGDQGSLHSTGKRPRVVVEHEQHVSPSFPRGEVAAGYPEVLARLEHARVRVRCHELA